MLARSNVAVEVLPCLSSAITHAELHPAHLKAAEGGVHDTTAEPLFGFLPPDVLHFRSTSSLAALQFTPDWIYFQTLAGMHDTHTHKPDHVAPGSVLHWGG